MAKYPFAALLACLPIWIALASGDEMLTRVRARRLSAEIDKLEAELERLEPGSDAHSESLHRLIALQKDKRSGAES